MSEVAPSNPVEPAVAPTASTAGALVPADASAQGTTATNANQLNAANPYGNTMGGYGGYDSYGGMGYGGMGYGGMGYGGMGMGYGGLGMGYGMGMGMGMGMYGMTPEAQRGQMMMFMISSMVQLWGMLSQVVQGTLGSVVQFVGNYVGLNQRLAQVEEEGMVQEEHYRRRCVQFKKDLENVPIDREEIKQRKRHARLHSKSKQPSLLRKIIISVIRHTLLLVLAYFMSKRITTLLSKKPTPQLL